MMATQNGNIAPCKTAQNGIKGKPPYSVETPYGFRLDLDFLKYVDDIEKGNTIKRIPIQRRSKGARASTLPRHLNASGCGYRPSPWGSTGALVPRSRLSDAHHHGYTSWAYDHRPPLSPTGFKSLAEMEARIKEFDEQPLGEHIRPHLLRASSLPLTVLLRQGSESTDDHSSLWSSKDHLGGRNISCEDVFHSSDSPRPQDCSGLLRRLTEALERVGELEMEVRVIPELRAQICILQEERERLRLGLNPHDHPSTMNGAADPCASSHYSKVGKGPQHESHNIFPRNFSVSQVDSNPTHEWRSSTDLDELLTVTSLQAKVAVLEQKLHETSLELQRVSGLLKEQQKESRRKDEKIEHLIKNPAVWVRAEKVLVDQDGDEMVRSLEADYSKAPCFTGTTTVTTNGQRSQQHKPVVSSTSTERSPPISVETPDSSAEGTDTAVLIHHIEKIKSLLDQQWKCLFTESKSGEEGKPLKHPDPKVNSLQQEMMGLVDILTSYYKQHGDSDASKSILRTEGCAQTSKNLHSGGVNEGPDREKHHDLSLKYEDHSLRSCQLKEESGSSCVLDDTVNISHISKLLISFVTGSKKLADQDCMSKSVHGDLEQRNSSTSPGEVAAAQVDADAEKRRTEEKRQMGPDRQAKLERTGFGGTDGGVVSLEARAAEKMAKLKAQPSGEQMEGNFGLETTTKSRETVNADFISACRFLNDHMDNMDNPNDDMRKALVVLFQHWFGAAAEEASEASRVVAYLKHVKKETPSLLAFLINLADDNGNTVLHYSVSHCNYSIVSLLLDTGVSDVNIQNNSGYTAVMLASLTAPDGPGGMEVVRKLMELGNINIRSSKTGQTALHLAVRHGRVVMVRLLLSCGADANIQDIEGTTALMFASDRGHTHIARLLLERSQCELALTDKRGQTALSIAMQGSHADTAALLQAHAKARAL